METSRTVPTKKLPGGWSMDRVAYSPAGEANALEYIKRMRLVVELPRTDAMAGSRFDSDDVVYVRLESMYAEVEFNQWPMACVEAALIDAAQSDYWYTNEKDYGREDEPFEEPEENDGC